MKKSIIIIQIVLLLAVGLLYYWHFTCNKNNTTLCKSSVAIKPGNSRPLIAYVDLDSLNEKIVFIKNNRLSLEMEQKSIESEWEKGYRDLENQKNNFLKKGSAITQSQAEEFQNILLQQQQNIDNKKQVLMQKLNQKSFKFMEDIQKKLKEFLEDYNKNNQFTYIFTTGNGLDYMVYKDSSYNITHDVIDGMNEKLNP